MHRPRLISLVAVICLAAAPTAAFAAKGGSSSASSMSCSASGMIVQASNLPTDQVINFMLTDASGTTGWVLGYTPDGSWSVNVPAPNGPTTYEFASRTYGSGGSKYKVFASCSS